MAKSYQTDKMVKTHKQNKIYWKVSFSIFDCLLKMETFQKQFQAKYQKYFDNHEKML